MTYYMDSCTVITIFNGNSVKAAAKLNSLSPNEVKIPSMVRGEILTGVYKNRRAERKLESITRILAPFETIPFDLNASEMYARIRADLEMKGNTIGPKDMIIAATVLSRGGILVTENTKEFRRVEGLHVENWCE